MLPAGPYYNSNGNNSSHVKSTIFYGLQELSQSVMFAAALYWADEGRQVIYISPSPINKLPGKYHDGSNYSAAALKLMRFMYIPNYASLTEKLSEIHNYSDLPSIILIDDLDHYLKKKDGILDTNLSNIAKTCAILKDTANACFRNLNPNTMTVHLVAWTNKLGEILRNTPVGNFYWDSIWQVCLEADSMIRMDEVTFDKNTSRTFSFYRLEDETIVLKEMALWSLP